MQRTYPAPAPLPWPPPVLPAPGPAALGPAGVQGGRGTGVPGVAFVPVTAVAPPAQPGGPHPLPALPPCPLPWGFPNPFAIRAAVVPAPPAQSGSQSWPARPGMVTVTGPAGYLPGIGYFDPLQVAAAAAPLLEAAAQTPPGPYAPPAP
ncbi:hypothetical protein [Symbiobacterium thermophilum]|uniref:Uncharacterized protein n=2 Tax=Symbiobacterium thermophilum TaxID=2734 RepID=Q67NC0_SYMTH|nr:hypothetical protein [Symbiobacterium thermophilum]MBY6276419.1 hypothetical protein [Symbiobacterium thermophilum]BAD40823.1 hypothetical protein, proline-rich [Symbiobacterium thermophilum IAM 14863]